MSDREDPIYLQAYTGDDGVIELRDQNGRPLHGVIDLNLQFKAFDISKAVCEVEMHSKDGEPLVDGHANDGVAETIS